MRTRPRRCVLLPAGHGGQPPVGGMPGTDRPSQVDEDPGEALRSGELRDAGGQCGPGRAQQGSHDQQGQPSQGLAPSHVTPPRPPDESRHRDLRGGRPLRHAPPDRPGHPHGSLEIQGEGREVPGLGLVFEDPEIFPADWTPRLSVVSLDIETDPAARRLLAISLHGRSASEVLLLTPPGRGCPDGARPFSCATPSSGWTTTASTPAPPPRSRRLLDRRLRLSRDRPPEPHPARGHPGGSTSVERLRGRTKRRRTPCGSRLG